MAYSTGNVNQEFIGLGRKLPMSVEAEMAVIGSALTYTKVAVGAGLEARHFVTTEHQALWAAILEARQNQTAFDDLRAKQYVVNDPRFSSSGGEGYIARLMECAAVPINATEYARLIIESFYKRWLVDLGENVQAAAYSSDVTETPEVLIKTFEAELAVIKRDLPNGSHNGWINGTDIDPKNVQFLWKNRFVANRINIIAGMGDVGKDVFCCTVAGCVTTGRAWPDGSPGCELGIVGVISPEDDADDTIIPRLMAAGCDMKNIRIWTANRRPTPGEISDLKTLIVSPLINLMGGEMDMNREQDARDFLELWQATLKNVDAH